jgi:hypothetical protein
MRLRLCGPPLHHLTYVTITNRYENNSYDVFFVINWKPGFRAFAKNNCKNAPNKSAIFVCPNITRELLNGFSWNLIIYWELEKTLLTHIPRFEYLYITTNREQRFPCRWVDNRPWIWTMIEKLGSRAIAWLVFERYPVRISSANLITLRFFVVFLSPMQMLEQYIKWGYDHFLPRPF